MGDVKKTKLAMGKKILVRQLGDLKPNPENPRVITDDELKMLKKSLDEHGDLDGFVFNRRSNRLIGAHQRTKVSPRDAVIHVDRSFDEPTKTGTVAEGWIEINGERHKYREVDVDDIREKAMNIAANKHGGNFDNKLLAPWLIDIDAANYDTDLIGFTHDEIADIVAPFHDMPGLPEGTAGDLYTKKIEAPVYEPKGEKPAIKDLFDSKKTEELLKSIDESDLPKNEKEFLRIAAQRHTVFNYEKVAEYYAHAPKPVQELMEDSALVIIDFEKAIENGFVVMSKEIAEAYAGG